MKKIGGFMLLILILTSCGPKPYYETSEGKKKLKHYNRIQYGQDKNR
ncbi:MAG: hypothetical protein RIA63_09700 [Cyclobacteriaceae bacterium]